MSDDWLEQLNQLREADQRKRQPKVDPAAQQQQRQQRASELLRRSRALELIRQMQKALLDGQGMVDVFDSNPDYDRLIALAWQGPISAARRPNPDDPEPYFYITVGVRDNRLWVNDHALPEASPASLKAALLRAAQNPKKEKPEQ